MENNEPTVLLLTLSALMLVIVALMLCSCKASPLIPYAVEIVPPTEMTLPTLPQVLPEPYKVNSDYYKYKSVHSEQSYLVPLRLIVSADSSRARAIMLESHDGKRAVFQAIISPPPIPESDVSIQPVLYPIDRMVVRTLTSSQDSTLWRVTVSSGQNKLQPYTLLLNIQIFGRQNIADFKALLKSETGFLLEARFTLNTSTNSQFEIGVPISLHHLSITEQTM